MREFWHKSHSTYLENLWKSFRINRKSFQNRPKTTPKQEKSLLGAFSAPNRAQVGSGEASGFFRVTLLETFCPKMELQGSILGTLENRKSTQNRTLEDRRALGPSKNGLWEDVRKKRENLSKNRCENGRFMMARKHVWRYTLRLFHTFAIFEKSQKINVKRDAKQHIVDAERHRRTPWTLAVWNKTIESMKSTQKKG